ncbi:MAG: ABC transporter substrate-binding protein [Phycisphaerales bacterium]|nr:ABC transporter substrate-binding protein [Phycisphaerales bacterium]
MLKAIACTAAAASLVLLAGIGPAPAPRAAESPAPARAAAKQVKIGVSVPAADHGWTAGVGWWAKKAMELHPEIDWIYATADRPEKQIADVEDMMVKGIDGLVILCTESAPLTPIAKRAHDKGIFIVNVDRGFLEPVADIVLEGDNKAFGRKSAQFVADRMKKEGRKNLVILTGIPCTVDTDRVTAAKEVFAGYPDIKILDTQPAMWNREKGLQVMENLLSKHRKIDAVWAQDDDIMLGAIQAIKESGRDNEMWIVGGAGMKDAVQMVMNKDPMVPADITYPPSMIATGVHMAASVMRDGHKDEVLKFMPRHLMIDVELITPENAKDYYFPESVY